MITTMNEIEQRFDAIKDHKPKASKKLNELGEILASAYKISPDRADEMWQYLVELNVRDDEKNAKFYIAQVFNKVKGLISEEEATDLIMMTPERVELMLLYGYDGGTLYSLLNTLTISFLKNENINNVMASLEYVFEKFGGIDSEKPELLKATKAVIEVCENLLNINFNYYKTIVKELISEIENLSNKKISSYGKIESVILNLSRCENIEELLINATEFSFSQEFLELLWIGKEKISIDNLGTKWLLFTEKIDEISQIPFPEYCCLEEKMNFYVNLITTNKKLLDIYFSLNKGLYFKHWIFYKWIFEKEWDNFAEYIAKSLISFEDPYQNGLDSGYMNTLLNPFIDGYFMEDYNDRFDQWGRSIKIINKYNIEDFINALCKASAMAIGCKFHEEYHVRIKEFVEKATGDMSCFEKYGFSEKLDTRSGLERLEAFAQNFLKSGKREIAFRVPSHELGVIMDKINEENYALAEPKDIIYLLACNDDIIEFYYMHTRQYSLYKGKMLASCIKHNNIERAIKIIELLKNTQAYENYNDLDGWERQFGLTIEECIQEFDTSRFAWKQNEITSGMIEQCKEIAHMCFEYLSEESIDRIKAEIRRICPNEDGADEYIQKLLDDVKIYCTFPKPRVKNEAHNINRISDEIWKSFKILSNMRRIDVICQIMEQFAAVKDILKPVAYDTWINFMNHGIKDEDCIKIFRESRMVYEVWLGANTREWDIKEVARKINKYGTNEEYEDFKRLVISRCGKIEGIDEYCESNNWE